MGCGGSKEADAPPPAAKPAAPPPPTEEELAARAAAAAAAAAAAEAEAAARAEADAAAAAESEAHSAAAPAGPSSRGSTPRGVSRGASRGLNSTGSGVAVGQGSLKAAFLVFCKLGESPNSAFCTELDASAWRKLVKCAGLLTPPMRETNLDAIFRSALKLNPAEAARKNCLYWEAFLGACAKLASEKGCPLQEVLDALAAAQPEGEQGSVVPMITANKLFKRGN